MIKIGFVDWYLDNWHANHYPEYLRLAIKQYGFDMELTHAYAFFDHPNGGMTTKQWCEEHHCIQCESYEQLLSLVDAVFVLGADDCTNHEELSKLALMSGKPVYCDKTFAPTYESARRMFDLASQYNTPVFSCSAQRFCMEILSYQERYQEPVYYCNSKGPGDMVNYSVHQFEMIQMLMGTGVKRCMALQMGNVSQLVYEYADGRGFTFCLWKNYLFELSLSSEHCAGKSIAVTDYYMNFFYRLLQFFQTGNPPVKKEDTLEVMAMIRLGKEALHQTGVWINRNILGNN